MLRYFILKMGKRGPYLARRSPYGARETTIYAWDAAPIDKLAMAEAVAERIAKPGERWEIRHLDKIRMTEEVVKTWPQ